MSDPIAIRELLEQRLDYERTIVAQRFEHLEKSRDIQAKELERRLEVLNHAHEAAVAEQIRVLPREMFDQFIKEFRLWQIGVNSEVTKMSDTPARVDQIIQWKNRVEGGLLLAKAGGISGIAALLYGILHLAGVLK